MEGSTVVTEKEVGVLDTGWRIAVVAAGYVGAQIAMGRLLVGLGVQTDVDLGTDPVLVLVGVLTAGLLVGTTAGLLARRIPVSRRAQVLVWGSLIGLNMAAVVLEGTFFAPDLAPVENLPGGLFTQVVVGVVTGGLVAWLFVPPSVDEVLALRERPWPSWLARVLTGAVVYVVLFFVVGGLNYEFVTRPYYETHFAGLTTPPVEVVLALELVRGTLIVLSVIPFVRAVPGERRRRAAYTGGILFVFAGLVPLLFQAFTFPPFLLFASGYEILLQVGPTGAVVAVLLGPGDHG